MHAPRRGMSKIPESRSLILDGEDVGGDFAAKSSEKIPDNSEACWQRDVTICAVGEGRRLWTRSGECARAWNWKARRAGSYGTRRRIGIAGAGVNAASADDWHLKGEEDAIVRRI